MGLALYPGTFDPVTRGHVDVIERASRLFDRVEVAVSEESGRETLFTPSERVRLIEAALEDAEIGAAEVVPVRTFDGLLVDYAERRGADVLVRGLRRASDFDAEYQMAVANRTMRPGLETVCLITSGEYGHISSTLVREIYRHGGDLAPFVPDAVRTKLERRRTSGSFE